MVGHLPTLEARAMPNLIPIDFYTERKPNTIYPSGCMQDCFSGKCVIFVLATKAISGQDSQVALVTVSPKHNCPNPLP